MTALTFDAVKHEYRDETGRIVPNVTTILASAGLTDPTWFDAESRTRGQFVHEATALWDTGDLDYCGLDDAIVEYVNAWRDFLTYTGFHHHEIELPVHNARYGYAGTADRIGVLDGKYCCIDIKSGAPSIADPIQLAAYAMAVPNATARTPYRFNVYLSADGKYKLVERKNRNNWPVFQSALMIHSYKLNGAK